MDVIGFDFQRKTSSLIQLNLLSLFYTFVRWLKATWNCYKLCNLLFQPLKICFDSFFGLILFTHCQVTDDLTQSDSSKFYLFRLPGLREILG